MGRPKGRLNTNHLPKEYLKKETIVFRVTKSQVNLLMDEAFKINLTLSDYIRFKVGIK